MGYTVLKEHEAFRGRRYGEWFCDFWNWVIAVDPTTDEEIHQEGPVIFCRGGANLYGQGGAVFNIGKRKLEITTEQAIFVAIMPTVADNVNTPDCETEEKRRAFVRRATDESQSPRSIIFKIDDDVSTPDNLLFCRIETPAFKLTVPDSPYGKLLKDQMDFLKYPGNHDAVADGYVILILFGEGHHTMYLKAGGRYGYLAEGLYEIDVLPVEKSIIPSEGETENIVKVPSTAAPEKLERMKDALGLDSEMLKYWKDKLDKQDWSFEWVLSTPKRRKIP
jgi:hypothetical protein